MRSVRLVSNAKKWNTLVFVEKTGLVLVTEGLLDLKRDVFKVGYKKISKCNCDC